MTYSHTFSGTLPEGSGAIFAMLGVYLIFLFIWWLLLVIASWKVFTKIGEPGWKAIIPFYGDYVMTVRTWNATPFWIVLGCSTVTAILSFISNIITASGGASAVTTVLSVISGVISIVGIVFTIRKLNHVSRSFGKGSGFTVGLILLAPIFMMILGFGSDEYIGPVE